MDLSNLFSKVKDLAGNADAKETVKKIANSDAVKSAVKKVANNKDVKKTVAKAKNAATKATKTVSKVAKAVGIDMSTIISYAAKNKAVMDILVKLGLKKESNPASGAVQKLVGSLKSAVSKAAGIKLEDKSFGSAVTKLLGVEKIKTQLENTAGKGVVSFIKKAVSEYIA